MLCFRPHAYSYSHFKLNKENLKISGFSYRNYIRPQLFRILQDFRFVLSKLNPLNVFLLDLRETLVKSVTTYELNREKCAQELSNCQEMMSKVSAILTKAERINNQKLITFTSNQKLNLQDTNLIILERLVKISGHINYLLNQLALQMITPISRSKEVLNFFRVITAELKESIFELELCVTLNIDNFNEEFSFIWESFYLPIELLTNNSKKARPLSMELEGLNMAWNTFHMKVAKDNRKLPKELLKIVQMMHNRWNAILKVILDYNKLKL